MENLAKYIIRVFFSQGQITYLDHEAKDVYTSKGSKFRTSRDYSLKQLNILDKKDRVSLYFTEFKANSCQICMLVIAEINRH